MAVFRPFRAFRPLPDYQALIPAPPYDVLTTAGARERAAGNAAGDRSVQSGGV